MIHAVRASRHPGLRPSAPEHAAVSVAMATHNGGRYVEEQLDSIAAQTERPREIVVCDDASSDSTAAVVERFASRSPVPLRLERNPVNLGYADNFLKAASLTTEPYIAFCDQDDIWRPDKVAHSVSAIRDTGAVMAVHAANLVDGAGRSIGAMRRNIGRTASFPPCTLEPWTMFWGFSQLFDRRLLDLLPNDRATRGADSNDPARDLGHDGWTSFLAGCFGTVATIDETLVDYRQHGGNVFGFEDRGLFGKIRAKMADEGSRRRRLGWLADIAAHRLGVLESHAGRDPLFAAPIAHWRRVYRHCLARRDMNAGASLPGRLGRLAANVARGTYRHPRRGGLGLDRLLEDATLGVLRPRQRAL